MHLDNGARILEPVLFRIALRVLGRGLAAAVCGLAGHVALYRALWPKGDLHGYLNWYEPLVAALSLAAIVALVVLVALAVAAERLGWRFHLPGSNLRCRPFGLTAVQVGGSGLLYLALQETMERSLAAHSPAVASFTASQWLAALAGIFSAAVALTFLMRLGETIVRAVCRRMPVRKPAAPLSWSALPAEQRRSRPLALRAALRAPPRFSLAE